jgi:hypothetical protein
MRYTPKILFQINERQTWGKNIFSISPYKKTITIKDVVVSAIRVIRVRNQGVTPKSGLKNGFPISTTKITLISTSLTKFSFILRKKNFRK